MIEKVVNHLIAELLDLFKERSIDLTAKYSPELHGFSRYVRDFYFGRTDNLHTIDSSSYQNKLLYNIGTPKLTPDRLKNVNLQALIKNTTALASDISTITFDPNASSLGTYTKVRHEHIPGSGNIVIRDASLLDVPVSFMMISEENSKIFDTVLLFYQKLRTLDGLEVEFKFNPYSDDLTVLSYFLEWDIESLEINYANLLENKSALNTISFNLNIQGGFYSNYYTETGIINTIIIKTELLNEDGTTY